MSDEILQTYGFTYTDCDGKEHTKTIKTPGATWHECMDDYVKFLESVFGYKIKSQVRLEAPFWMNTDYQHKYEFNDPWTGEYFEKDLNEDSRNS